jgi:hypothetical protein
VPDTIERRKRGPVKITSRLPRLFVFGVWSVTIVGFLLLWFATPLLISSVSRLLGPCLCSTRVL